MAAGGPPGRASLFAGRTLLIATQHGKEGVIAPPLEAALGVRCRVSEAFDTDLLGTFSGEIERTLSPLAAAREKCRRALAEGGADLAVASEGSFGPHPAVPLAPGDEELLLLVDQRHGLEISASTLSLRTNYAAAELADEQALLDFAERAGFPRHGLILRRARDSLDSLHKGIVERDTLLATFARLRARYPQVRVETDMRALYNPTRMAVIAETAERLAQRAATACPHCEKPGYGVEAQLPGLPCAACNLPTRALRAERLGCSHCGFSEERARPDGRTTEDPMYCDYCNP